LIYYGENSEYILCECETCKKEMYVERTAVAEEDAYAYHLLTPIKCRCGAIDEYINRAKKSCHSIKHELSALTELLRKQQNISGKISDIKAELNKKFESPSFFQSVGKDILFSLKVFLILLGSVVGVEIFLFIVSSLLFFLGLVFTLPDLQKAGNELFYNVNIFKDRGGEFLSRFGWNASVKPLNAYDVNPSEGLIFGYIPAAVAGVILIVFYIFLAILIIRMSISIAKLTFFASKVVNRQIKIAQRKDEYRKMLEELGVTYNNISDQIDEINIIPADYKTLRASELILRYFVNNRVDTIREALNLYHEEDFRNRNLEYTKAMYNEAKQTRRYTKALYMLTSDENIKVDVKDVREESSENDDEKVSEILKDAFAKIKKPSKVSQISSPPPQPQSALKNKKIASKQNASNISSGSNLNSAAVNTIEPESANITENDENTIIPEEDESGELDLVSIFDDPPEDDE